MLVRLKDNRLRSVITILATGFGAGYAPFAPGTMGTAVGIPLYLIFSGFTWPVHLIGILALTAGSFYVADSAERMWEEKDASRIVIDEIAGVQFALFLVTPTFLHVAAGFILFRLFDITKLFPADLCETKLPGGYAVVMDDIVAGLYANVVLQLTIHFTGM